MTTNKERQEEFAAFIKVLADRYKPLYIYCFAELAESSSKAGCFSQNGAVEDYRYYLLMVIESETRIEHAVQDYTNGHFHHGHITILVHGKDTVTQAIRANNNFLLL